MAHDLDDEELAATRKLYGLDNKETEITLGTLYDLNKQIIKNEPKMKYKDLLNKKDIFLNYMKNHGLIYYMLLCNEQKDYTIFNLNYDDETITSEEKCFNELIECLQNRGNIVGFDLTKQQDAIEIWLLIKGEAFCYYFFNYDNGVIEC